jgi:hypothetical protein
MKTSEYIQMCINVSLCVPRCKRTVTGTILKRKNEKIVTKETKT